MAAGLPSAVLVEIEFTAGVWTDVGSLVKGDSIEIHVGRDSAASGIQPGTLDLDLDNADGRFTPDNPTSTHYPNFVEGKRIRVRVTKSATTYVRFVGRITSLEPSFPTGEPSQSVTHVAAVDALGDLARITLTTYPAASQIENYKAAVSAAYYPLTDINEHVGMFDPLEIGDPLGVYDRTPGSGKIEARADETLDGSQAYVQLFDGKGLWHPGVGIPASVHGGGAVHVTLCVKVSSSSYGEVVTIGNYRRDSFSELSKVAWSASGFVVDVYSAGALLGSSAAIPAADGWHYLQLTAGGGSNSSLIVNNGASVDAGFGHGGTMRFVSIGGDLDMSAAHLVVSDSSVSVYDALEVLPNIGTIDDLAATLTTMVSASGLQMSVNWSGSAFSPSDPAALVNRNALDALVTLADSQHGIAYASPSTSPTQSVIALANVDARPTTVALTVDAEGDLTQGPTLIRQLDGRVSAATGSSPSASVTVVDSSVTDVGSADVEVQTALYQRNDLHAVASDRIARGRDQATRISSLTVDLATASNDLYAAFYAVTPGERLRLSGLPTTYFGVSYIDGYVEGWTERPGVTGYEVVFDLSPADAPTEARYDTGRYAFGDGVCTVTSGTAVGTTSTGTIVLTWATSPTLSTAAGDYPMDFDWNGERVTVTSAPAGGTSPRTLTITARGVAPTVARSHSAGESIEPWDAARYAL